MRIFTVFLCIKSDLGIFFMFVAQNYKKREERERRKKRRRREKRKREKRRKNS